MLLFQANMRGRSDVPGDANHSDFTIDGISVGGTDDIYRGVTRIVSYSLTEAATTIWVAQPEEGLHTFRVQWRVDADGAEATVNQEGFANQFSAIEFEK